jgi:hypothetical protein
LGVQDRAVSFGAPVDGAVMVNVVVELVPWKEAVTTIPPEAEGSDVAVKLALKAP